MFCLNRQFRSTKFWCLKLSQNLPEIFAMFFFPTKNSLFTKYPLPFDPKTHEKWRFYTPLKMKETWVPMVRWDYAIPNHKASNRNTYHLVIPCPILPGSRVQKATTPQKRCQKTTKNNHVSDRNTATDAIGFMSEKFRTFRLLRSCRKAGRALNKIQRLRHSFAIKTLNSLLGLTGFSGKSCEKWPVRLPLSH